MSDAVIFDRRAVRLRRDRAATSVGLVREVLTDVADRLLDRLLDTKIKFHQALDLGGRGVIAPALRARGMEVISADLSPRMAAINGGPNGGLCVCADEEWLPFAENSFDLIVANLSLHQINDLPGALLQARRCLQPDGLFLASVPLIGTLGELRTSLAATETELRGGVASRVSPFPDLRDCAGLLQRAGFSLPVADLEEIQLLYTDPLALLRDLRMGGETNATIKRDRTIPPRALFPLALAALPPIQNNARLPEVKNHIAITLKIGMLTGWK